MRIQHVVSAVAASLFLGTGLAAVAQAVPVERILVVPANVPFGPYHGGFVTDSDAQLLSDALGTLASDRSLDGSIVTMVATHGRLIVNGSATNAQAFRIERQLKGLNGGTHVSSWFSSSGG